jgi:hypothetical protein
MNKIPLTIYLDLASYEKIQQAVEHAAERLVTGN